MAIVFAVIKFDVGYHSLVVARQGFVTTANGPKNLID
jgi:hypothetical protein